MLNQISTQNEESTFKTSFPDIQLENKDNLVFKFLFNECQKILNSLTKETDEKEIENKFIKAFNYDNTNFKLIEKIKEKDNENLNNLIDLYKPLFKYNFKNKIFDLIEIIKKYNKKDILLKFQINEIINNDYNELKDLVEQFNKEINNENEKLIYMVIYYYWIFNLINKINYYKDEIDFKYKPLENLNENEDKNNNFPKLNI